MRKLTTCIDCKDSIIRAGDKSRCESCKAKYWGEYNEVESEERTCSSCKDKKNISEFYRDNARKFARRPTCKKCENLVRRNRYRYAAAKVH